MKSTKNNKLLIKIPRVKKFVNIRKEKNFWLLITSSGHLFTLNKTAKEIFDLMNNNSIEKIINQMCKRYGEQIDNSIIKEDVIAIIKDFEKIHAIEL